MFDVIVIGAGAAGLFCAAEVGKRKRRVLILEHQEKPGKKILISGGGRCNFTNLDAAPENYISNNPHFAKSALARYTAQDFVKLVEKHKIEYYEKKLGQLFCRDSARQIVKMLIDECDAANAKIRTNCTVGKIVKTESGFKIETDQNVFECHSLVIATGGLSFPKVGATDFGFKVAKQFDLKIVPPRPSLVPLVFAGEKMRDFADLAGISLDVNASCGAISFRENVLFTHRGLSGPAILQISNYWKPGKSISFDLLPTANAVDLLHANRGSKQELTNFLAARLPQRFAEKFCRHFTKSKPIFKLSEREIRAVGELLGDWQIAFDNTEGYHKAEVTLGGVDTNELSSKTMETKKVKGLYFIGEIVDVTGWLGGYNFQWAWASGFAAGQAA